MRLSDLFTGNNQISAQNQTSLQQMAPVRQPEGSSAQGSQMQNLTPGQVLSGELVSSENGEVQIKLLNDLLLDAKLDQNIPLEMGKLLNFQVRSNGKALMLTPLQANLSMEGPVQKALEMANLPVNSATAELAKQMMQAGLPIDRNSMQQIYREMIHHPSGSIEDLVDLHKIGLPVSEENLAQASSYKNLTHQLSEGLAETSASLLELTDGLLAEGKGEVAAHLFLGILTVMGEEAQDAAVDGSEQREPDNLQNGEMQTVNPQGKEAGTLEEALSGAEAGKGQLPEAGAGIGKSALLAEDLMKQYAEIRGKQDDGEEASAGSYQEKFSQLLEKTLQDPQLTTKEQMDLVSRLLNRSLNEKDSDVSKAVLESPQTKKLLSEQFQKQWSVTPGQVADPREVENLYGRLERQLRGIAKALDQAGQNETPAFQNTANMNQNLDFLQQINQMYQYVQLPLRLTQGQANGDLYVYTNKKNLSSKDGPITALLHLDMEHLGALDVYVSMQMEKVSTKFYVQDDEMLDFLEQHMQLLTDRLEKRGYDIAVSASLKNQEEASEGGSGLAPILAQTGPGRLIQARGFDVRT